MVDWRAFCIGAYYRGTALGRRFANWRDTRHGQLPVLILFHHRIADDRANSWTISTRVFDRQIDWLQQNCDIVSLAEAQRRIQAGWNDRPTVSITFDDGYADNCLHAVPTLLKRQIPFTYFVTTNHIRTGDAFPHDVAFGHPLAPNSVAEIKSMADAGVEIGVHTQSHVDLGTVSSWQRLHAEIVEAKDEVEFWTGKPANYFAFPFGQLSNLNQQAIQLIQSTGYSGFCSAYGGYNEPGDDSFHLLRFHADEHMSRFLNWVTIDPRKRKKHSRRAISKLDSDGLAEGAETERIG